MRHLVRLYLIIFFFLMGSISALCEGKMIINPLTDICWKCVFPLEIAGINAAKSNERQFISEKSSKALCRCPAVRADLPTFVGVPLSFWEPTRIIEVTRTPGKLICLGGLKLPGLKSQKSGAVYSSGGPNRYANYHVHVYEYPLFNLLDIAKDFVCTEFEGKGFEIEIPYMSELDLEWKDEKIMKYLNPEVLLFSNPLAQVSCASDCFASTLQKPNDKLFWCAGCQGSLFPLMGFVADYIGGLQASLLLLQRVIAKMHHWNLLQSYRDGSPFKDKSYCQREYMRRPKRAQYKTQLVYPVSSTKGPCQALGKTEVFWGPGKSFPVKGEEFAYILWTQRRCCLDPIKAGLKGGLAL